MCEARSSFNIWASFRIHCDMHMKQSIRDNTNNRQKLENIIVDYWLRVQSGIDDKLLTLWLINNIKTTIGEIHEEFPFIDDKKMIPILEESHPISDNFQTTIPNSSSTKIIGDDKPVKNKKNNSSGVVAIPRAKSTRQKTK